MKSRLFVRASALFLFFLVAPSLLAPSFFTPRLFAQAPSQSTPSVAGLPPTITLAQAIQRAIAENYTVRNAANLAEYNSIAVTQAKDKAWLPTAAAGASWRYDYSLSPVSARTLSVLQTTQRYVQTTAGDSLLVQGVALNTPIAQVITPAGSHSLNWDASASYNLFNGGSDLARIHASEASFGSDTNNFIWTRQATAFNVTKAYITILDNNEQVIAADSTLTEGLAQLDLVQGQYNAGVVAVGSVYQQKAIVEQDSVALIQAINNYNNAQAALLLLLNVPPNQYSNYAFTVAGIDTSTSLAARARIDTSITNEQLNAVIDQRPDILAQEQSIDALQYQIDITRGALLPSLNASGGIGGGAVSSSLSNLHFDNSLNVGLSLTIPIFDAMQNRLAIQEQEVNVADARIALEQIVQQIRSDATTAVNNLKAADQELAATQAELTSAEESFRLASEQLRVGAGTEVNLIIAESALETARVNWVNAKYNWVLAQKQLDYTLGKWNY